MHFALTASRAWDYLRCAGAEAFAVVGEHPAIPATTTMTEPPIIARSEGRWVPARCHHVLSQTPNRISTFGPREREAIPRLPGCSRSPGRRPMQ